MRLNDHLSLIFEPYLGSVDTFGGQLSDSGSCRLKIEHISTALAISAIQQFTNTSPTGLSTAAVDYFSCYCRDESTGLSKESNQ